MRKRFAQRAAQRAAQRKFPDRVRRCAGLSAVILECHRDTWDYMLRIMAGPWLSRGKWEKDPSDSITEQPADDSMIQVRLSGPRLAELMTTLWHLPAKRRWGRAPTGMMIADWGGPKATAAEEEQAHRLFDAIAVVIDRVELNTPRQGAIPTIVIDDAVG